MADVGITRIGKSHPNGEGQFARQYQGQQVGPKRKHLKHFNVDRVENEPEFRLVWRDKVRLARNCDGDWGGFRVP